jgi:hypothetical protein
MTVYTKKLVLCCSDLTCVCVFASHTVWGDCISFTIRTLKALDEHLQYSNCTCTLRCTNTDLCQQGIESPHSVYSIDVQVQFECFKCFSCAFEVISVNNYFNRDI